MIKFQATHPQNVRKILGIGLSHGNITKLMLKQPIHFNAEQMGLTDIRVSEVLIYVGETEESMREELASHGWLDGAVVIEENYPSRADNASGESTPPWQTTESF